MEVCFIAQAWAPTKGKLTLYKLNGQDKLSTLTVSDRETEYSSTLSGTNTNPDPNSPSKQLKSYLPMSSVILNVGYHLTFGKKKTSSQIIVK